MFVFGGGYFLCEHAASVPKHRIVETQDNTVLGQKKGIVNSRQAELLHMVACVSKGLEMSISKATHSVFILFLELVQYEQKS